MDHTRIYSSGAFKGSGLFFSCICCLNKVKATKDCTIISTSSISIPLAFVIPPTNLKTVQNYTLSGQLGTTLTQSSKNTLCSSIFSIAKRESMAISFKRAPLLPMSIAFCISRSTIICTPI